MSSPDELSSGSERRTVPVTDAPEAIAEKVEDAQVTVIDDNRPQAPLVLDASFVLAVLDGEPAAMRLVDLLRGSVLPSPTAGEVYLTVAERSGLPPAQIQAVLLAYGVRLVDLPMAAAHHFPELRRIDSARRQAAQHAGQRRFSLSLGDLCVLAYALLAGLPVLTGDRQWSTLGRYGLSVPVHPCQH